MHILFITHYFYPEGNAPATRVYEMTRRWVQAGHRVTVLTGVPNVPNGVVYTGYRNRWRQFETIEGVSVERVWTYLAPNKGTIRRTLNYLSFMVVATFAGRRMWRRGQRSEVRDQNSDVSASSLDPRPSTPAPCPLSPDLVIATSPQFFCGWAGARVARGLGVPLILEVRDIWPESIKTVGAVTQPRLIRFLEHLERKLYARASHIVTVGEGYRRHLVERGVSPDRLSVVPNGVDRIAFQPREPDLGLKKRYELENSFVCSYIGTIGMAAGLGVVLRAAGILKEQGNDKVRFLLVGDGAMRQELEEKAKARGLDNVIFTGRQDKSMMPAFLSISDACLVHLRRAALFEAVIPSKIYEAAAMARPIILGLMGDAARFVQRAGAGICIEPENEQALVAAIEKLSCYPELGKALGEGGQREIASLHDYDKLAQDYLQVIETNFPNSRNGRVM